MQLNLLTPERKIVYQLEVDEVLVPAFKGELNILPGHAPMVTTLSTGILRWKPAGSGTFQSVVISWGYCEVIPGGINVLADAADLPTEIDQPKVEVKLKTAEARLGTESLNDEAWDQAQREVARLRADLELIGVKTF